MSSQAFVNGSTLTDAGWFNDTDTLVYSRLTSVSGTNTVVGTGPVSMTAYATGQIFTFIPANTNTAATTLNITPSGGSALGAKNIFWNGAACAGGELKQNVPVILYYDGTQFNILGLSVQLAAPTFSASSAAATTPSTGVSTLCTLGTENWDTNSNFASNRFTPTVAGYYQINGSINSSSSSAITDTTAEIRKNGSAVYITAIPNNNNGTAIASVSGIVAMNGSTDYVELYGNVSAATPSMTGNLNGCWLRAL